MNAILSAAFVLVACGVISAADAKAVDPVGTWKCEYEIGGQKRTSTLKIDKDGDKLSGTMSWPDQGETKLKNLKLKEVLLTFTADRKLPGTENIITVDYKLSVDGDKIKGQGSSEVNGEKREWEIKATRQKSDK